MNTWPVNDAKNRFSDLLTQAQEHGPQIITRHGRERAVVLSIKEYRELTAKKLDFKAHLLAMPKLDDFEIERDQDMGRTIDL